MRKLFLMALAISAFMAFGPTGIASAGPPEPGEHPCTGPAGDKNPHCDDGDNGNGGNGEECVEEGPVSSIIHELEGELGPEGEPLANLLHEINCRIVVPLEEALDLNEQELGV